MKSNIINLTCKSPREQSTGTFDVKGEILMTEKEKIIEIESYYGQSLSEIVVRLTKEPIVRHFKGTYYRVMNVTKDCETGKLYVGYTALCGGNSSMGWSRELINFLEPVPDGREADNVANQKRRFEFVDSFEAQLDLVDTETLIEEVNKRSDNTLILSKNNIIATDYVVARVLTDPESGKKTLYDLVNAFSTKEQAEDNLERNRRHKKLLSDDYRVLSRIFVS